MNAAENVQSILDAYISESVFITVILSACAFLKLNMAASATSGLMSIVVRCLASFDM